MTIQQTSKETMTELPPNVIAIQKEDNYHFRRKGAEAVFSQEGKLIKLGDFTFNELCDIQGWVQDRWQKSEKL